MSGSGESFESRKVSERKGVVLNFQISFIWGHYQSLSSKLKV